MADNDETGKGRARLLRVPVRRAQDERLPTSRQVLAEDRPFREFESKGTLLKPPYPLRALSALPRVSSILNSCINAMEVNVDGFGEDYEYIGPDGQKDSSEAKAEKNELTAWFDNCHPFLSYMELRKRLRRDMEGTGNGYWEVLRDGQSPPRPSQIEHMPAYSMRIGRRDKKPTTMEITAHGPDGKPQKRRVLHRFRRFAQVQDKVVVWFKEFGDPRDFLWKTGELAPKGTAPDDLATEVWPFSIYDSDSAYGVPRWMGALLGIKGSRYSETVNYLFFERNAIPAMIIMVSGGHLVKTTVDHIEQFMKEESAGAENMHRVLILEGLPGDGAGQDEGTVRIEVKPLQAERQQDALFADYEKNNDMKVRRSFRFGQMFIGETQDHNFATAMASRLQGEEQVFDPERKSFDSAVNRRLLRALGARFWAMFTKGPEISDMVTVTTAVDIFTRTGAMTVNAVVKLANEMLGTSLAERTEDWADMPFALVEILATQGKLAGLEKITKEQPLAATAGAIGEGGELPESALKPETTIGSVPAGDRLEGVPRLKRMVESVLRTALTDMQRKLDDIASDVRKLKS